jgi:hypothetical protein
MNEQFATMLYSNRHLIIKTVEGKNPFAIAECYLPDVAAQICKLLTTAAKNKPTLENTQKGDE